MAGINELPGRRIPLAPYHLSHLQHLVAEWELLADLFFADLLLFVPEESGEGERFLVLAHVRPTNSETTYREDPVGTLWNDIDRPWVSRAFRSGETVGGFLARPGTEDEVRVQSIPVRAGGGEEVIAVLSVERYRETRRKQSSLEDVYSEIATEIADMISEGSFPYRGGGPVLTETLRAGDGLILLDRELRVRFISPNGMSALHRLAYFEAPRGKTLREVGVADLAVKAAASTGRPQDDELQIGDVSVLVLALPLLNRGEITGEVVLLRDVSEIRRRDRLLLSKEATIREIHHRVKNNLQTIASLLQLQARRAGSREVTEALSESVRRIKSIALVHELLSRDSGGWVPFSNIVQPLLRDVEDGLVDEQRVHFEIEGDAGDLPAEVATPLAVILTELLTNAVEHAFPTSDSSGDGDSKDATATAAEGLDGEPGRVLVRLERSEVDMTVEVIDNGEDFPPGFNLERDAGLGLRIVRTLATSELDGQLELVQGDSGGYLRLCFPVPYRPPMADHRLTPTAWDWRDDED